MGLGAKELSLLSGYQVVIIKITGFQVLGFRFKELSVNQRF
jgi:hypothetical protein